MFIIERLIGVGLFFAALVICWGLIRFTQIDYRKILLGYMTALALMGFFYEPYETSDLFRINQSIALFSACSFPEFVQRYLFQTTAPLSRLIYWIVGKIGIYALLPASAAALTYGCIFYIVIHAAQKCEISRRDIAMTVLFLMSTGSYMMTISNIRNMTAVAVVCLCFYRETIENKNSRWHILLYAAAALMHNMGVLVVLIRFAVKYRNIRFNWKKALIGLTGAICAAAVLWLIAPDFVEKYAGKVLDYLFAESYSYGWEYLSGSLILAMEFYILYYAHKHQYQMSVQWQDTRIFLLICLLVACVLCSVFTFFTRFSTFVSPILTAPLMMLVLKKDRQDKYHKVVFGLSLATLFLACARGQLCSLKFFVFPWNA